MWNRGAIIALVALLLSSTVQAAPFWGEKQSRPVDTPLVDLAPGAWIWGGDDKRGGPMAVIVSLTEQRAYVYRNGILIGVTTVSTGRPGYETPTGVFTVLQKDKDHHSNLYGNAPMPYQQRLTWDGIALHAGGLPGYPESHGCVHLPTEFARLLFDASNLGMTVVVSQADKAPISVVHPGPLSPIDATTGADLDIPRLADGSAWRWSEDAPTDGPVSLVLSRSDRLLVVYRNGHEIGRSRVELAEPGRISGTRAYIVASDAANAGHYTPSSAPATETSPKMPNWIAIGVPGYREASGQRVPAEVVNQVRVPDGFKARALPLLTPGTVLVATDAHFSTQTSGEHLRVIDSAAPHSWLDDILTE
ncbi:L,D-transpeptidase [Salinicola rhizosphaerae]|uniref:L,D-transpeptidase n=1 Tax=Salinicola rhizosphaerae TaxID=1443141 RepID=A0ABQ3E2X6_9GAMM|nr:L,D-transpeptidase [Salinicola rhizosphaerae]GHB24108.1 L,D-transpeptidase [Salinicola rhizosphaerae]